MADKAKIKLEIMSPHGPVFTGEVDHVRAPGVEGSFGVLPGHTPFLAPLEVGLIEADDGKDTIRFATSGGLAEVHHHSVTIMAETAEKSDSIDLDRAKDAEQRARQRLETQEEGVDFDRARLALMRSLNRQRIARG